MRRHRHALPDGARPATCRSTPGAPPMWSGSPWVRTSVSSRRTPSARSAAHDHAFADVEAGGASKASGVAGERRDAAGIDQERPAVRATTRRSRHPARRRERRLAAAASAGAAPRRGPPRPDRQQQGRADEVTDHTPARIADTATSSASDRRRSRPPTSHHAGGGDVVRRARAPRRPARADCNERARGQMDRGMPPPARRRHADAGAAATTSPPIWTTVISGMATKFRSEPGEGDPTEQRRARPAPARSPRTTVAANRRDQQRQRRRATRQRGRPAAVLRRQSLDARQAEQDPERRAEREMKSGVEDHHRRDRDRQQRGDRQHVERRRAMIERAREQHQHRHRDRARDRRGAAGDRAVEHSSTAVRIAPGAAAHQQQPRARSSRRRRGSRCCPRNRDDVIGAGLLQPALVVGGQPAAIADQHRGGDARRPRIAPADAVDAGAGGSTARTAAAASLTTRSAGQDFDQRRALDAADQHDALAGERGAVRPVCRDRR